MQGIRSHDWCVIDAQRQGFCWQHRVPQERVGRFYRSCGQDEETEFSRCLKIEGTYAVHIRSVVWTSCPDASESLISSLVLFKTFLLAQKPRLVSLSLSQTWTVFTDASYEHDEAGVPTARFGGVLVSPSGKPTNFFSIELPGKDLEKLNPTAKKTAIFQCEFFAVLVALNLWQQQLTNRQVVFYVDNDAVRDVLISCSTSNPVGHALLIKTLRLEGALALSSWFTRVPSKSNIADDRHGVSARSWLQLKCKGTQLIPCQCCCNLGLCPKWGRCQARRPQSKKER